MTNSGELRQANWLLFYVLALSLVWGSKNYFSFQELGTPTDIVTKSPLLGKNKLSLKTASFKELYALPGVSAKLAKKILAYRDRVGRNIKISELRSIRGVGKSKQAQLEKYLKD